MKLYKIKELKGFTLQDNVQEKPHIEFLKYLETPKELIDNIDTQMYFLSIKDKVLPVTINDAAYDTCYACSIYTGFISYGRSELKKINSFFLKKILTVVINFFEKLFRIAEIDRVISHNNFLLSTNLYPSFSIDKKELCLYLESLRKEFPRHAIIFRSLNEHANALLIKKLSDSGFILCPSRQVYIFDRSIKDFRKQSSFKSDLKILKRQSSYSFVFNHEIEERDYSRIAELYDKLYIEKYSKFNPDFNKNYIEFSHKSHLIDYFALRNQEGVIDAVVGCYDRELVTTAPIVGYDTSLPKKLGLYRMLMAYCINRADNKNLILNLSSGASHFKILRGGVPYIEYSALYIRHLKGWSFFTWNILRYMLKYIVIPIIKKYKL